MGVAGNDRDIILQKMLHQTGCDGELPIVQDDDSDILDRNGPYLPGSVIQRQISIIRLSNHQLTVCQRKIGRVAEI